MYIFVVCSLSDLVSYILNRTFIQPALTQLDKSDLEKYYNPCTKSLFNFAMIQYKSNTGSSARLELSSNSLSHSKCDLLGDTNTAIIEQSCTVLS